MSGTASDPTKTLPPVGAFALPLGPQPTRDLHDEMHQNDSTNELRRTGSRFVEVAALDHGAIGAATPTVPPELP
jgi:hypothetical protein